MQTLLVECVVRTSLIAAVVALVLYVMRIETASARHAVWAGVVLVMLLLPAFLIWGPRASLPVLPREARHTAVAMLPVENGAAPASTQMRTAAAAAQPIVWSWPAFLAAVYLLGVCVLLLRLAIGTARVRRLLRGAVLRDGRLTHPACSTPITVGWVQPSVILPADWTEWPQARLDAILVHEREHARRRDPLIQWIALLNRALFWVHPLAWWLERRLSGLAEESCDAAVLAKGHDPRDYSEYLLDLARSVERAGTRIDALGMAMPGAFLPQRIRRMLSGAPVPRISRPRVACAVAVCAVAAVILAPATLVRAQSGTAKGPIFDVVSIRPTARIEGGGDPDGGRSGGGGGGGYRNLPPQLEHGRLSLTITTFSLIAKAYGIQSCGLLGEITGCAQISGAPDWVKKDRFDIQAKSPGDTFNYNAGEFLEGETPQLRPMLQALLADRFNLKVHREQKQVPVYALTVGKNGPKFKPAAGEMVQLKNGSFVKNRSAFFENATPDGATVRLIVKNRTIKEVFEILSNMIDRPVLDRTGLTGEFDFTIEYERDPDSTESGALVGPSFFKAFQQQLGLKLEAAKGPVDVLVIDHVEKPSEN
jgi:bla regulator protein BlaR1